ncbi:MAG: type II toxin-antitoxin system VapC family toxin [Methanomicrobiales archaeon]|nr:type II toxin-antitoxin system VapC family toxin [Methanomicrobiales archaeon]
MEISELKVGSVFLDTNILLYAYTTTKFSSSCETLLELVQNGSIQGYVNSTVIDEFFHKVLLTQVYIEKHLAPRDAIVYIKQHPDMLKRCTAPYHMTKEVLEDYQLIVLDTSDVIDDTLNISQIYGLLFSDALHAACARKNHIDYFVTNDRDFDRIDFLSIVKP